MVKKINEKADSIKEDKKVDVIVTGSTAVNIDTDNSLSKAIVFEIIINAIAFFYPKVQCSLP